MTAPTLSSSRFNARPVITFAAFGGGELQHLAGLSRAESVDARHTIPHFKDGPDFIDVHRRQIGALDFLKENFLEFAGPEGRFRRHKPSICEWKCGQNLACENYHMETLRASLPEGPMPVGSPGPDAGI